MIEEGNAVRQHNYHRLHKVLEIADNKSIDGDLPTNVKTSWLMMTKQAIP